MADPSSPDQDFYKFPKTPHLAGSATVDDDEVLPASQLGKAATVFPGAERVVVQEKIDGANVGIHFKEQWQPIIQKRSGVVGSSEKAQYGVFRDWVFGRLELLWEILADQYVLFGEWLWNKHAIGYDKLPDYLVVFDIFDKRCGTFLSLSRVDALLAQRLPQVPVIQSISLNAAPAAVAKGGKAPAAAAKGKPAGQGQQDLHKSVTALLLRPSHFGTEQQEGVYVRIESADQVLFRCKMRRPTFEAGRADFAVTINNHLAGDSK